MRFTTNTKKKLVTVHLDENIKYDIEDVDFTFGILSDQFKDFDVIFQFENKTNKSNKHGNNNKPNTRK